MHPAIRILSLAADFASVRKVHKSNGARIPVLREWVAQDQRNWTAQNVSYADLGPPRHEIDMKLVASTHFMPAGSSQVPFR